MIVSPLDYELYSRVTGQPIPMSAAERMKMAPVVNEFTKNYTKAQNRQAMGRNILKIGALGALGAAAYYGTRDFGTPSQELGQDLVETSTASNLVQNAAEKAAASTASNTISQSITTDQTPEQTLENAAETSTPPSQLNINESVEASVKKPTPNIDAALERKNVRKPTPSVIRDKYFPYETAPSPEERQRRNVETMVGGGEIFIGKTAGSGEAVKTEEAQLYGDKGEKKLLGKYVGMMKKNVDPLLKEVSGQTTDTYGTELLVDDTFGHPDLPPGEDDIFQHGGTNTSPTTNLPYIDPKKVMAMATIGSGDVSNVFNQELAKRGVDIKSPEERLIAAVEVEKRRTPNPLEQKRTPRSPNELAGKDQATFEAIKAGIPKEEQEAAAQRLKEKTARKRAQTTGEKVDDFTAKFVEGAKSDIVRGRMGNKSLGITRIPPTNGDAQVGFVLANKPVDQSPKFAETYAYGVAPDAESMLDNQLDEKSFSTYMQRAMKEAKKGKKRVAGEIFEYLTPDTRVIEGDARLGDIEM